jgi:hypothetical protein
MEEHRTRNDPVPEVVARPAPQLYRSAVEGSTLRYSHPDYSEAVLEIWLAISFV